jgi:malonyl-CoA/methylmalonyl-CoA synthetase
LPDEEWGQIVGAITILKDPKFPMSLQTLQTWCRSRLANYKIPRKIIVVSEIPRNAMGKINKKELVKMFDRK